MESRKTQIDEATRTFEGRRTKDGRPYVRRLRRHAGMTDITTTERDESYRRVDLRPQPLQVSGGASDSGLVRHFQARVSEYGQLLMRAPNEPEIVGLLWRVNKWRGRSATGHFGQVVLFPAAMDPGRNDRIDYRIGNHYYTGTMPSLGEDRNGEWHWFDRWQWVEAEPGERYETFWYDLDKPDAPHRDWQDEMKYDMWLLTDGEGPRDDRQED